ncbi:hypothetical protein SLS60_003332 [Paraconiothyrium brasiliense]|uniref:Uncharacterized protein n=1 Tax=Paraconiothyrium brasiliense TaxID=300254 RepID=A0ABR3RVD9_9PLEO
MPELYNDQYLATIPTAVTLAVEQHASGPSADLIEQLQTACGADSNKLAALQAAFCKLLVHRHVLDNELTAPESMADLDRFVFEQHKKNRPNAIFYGIFRSGEVYIFLHEDGGTFPYKLTYHAFDPNTKRHVSELADLYTWDSVKKEQRAEAFVHATNKAEMVALAMYYFARLDPLPHHHPQMDALASDLLAVCTSIMNASNSSSQAADPHAPSTMERLQEHTGKTAGTVFGRATQKSEKGHVQTPGRHSVEKPTMEPVRKLVQQPCQKLFQKYGPPPVQKPANPPMPNPEQALLLRRAQEPEIKLPYVPDKTAVGNVLTDSAGVTEDMNNNRRGNSIVFPHSILEPSAAFRDIEGSSSAFICRASGTEYRKDSMDVHHLRESSNVGGYEEARRNHGRIQASHEALRNPVTKEIQLDYLVREEFALIEARRAKIFEQITTCKVRLETLQAQDATVPYQPDKTGVTRMVISPPVQRNRTLDKSAAQFHALRQLAAGMGAEGDLLDVLPFSQAVICLHEDQKFFTGKKMALAKKIRIGDIEDESGPASPLWAYLLDNNISTGIPDLTYYSLGKRRGKGTRHNATDVHAAILRDEYKHCETPSVLTATVKFYLYKKGVTASFPIEVSKTLVNLVTRSCKDYRDAIQEKGLGEAMEIIDTVEDDYPIKMEMDPGQVMPTPSQHPVPNSYNSPRVNSDSVMILQAAQARELQIGTAVNSAQLRLNAAKKNVEQLRTKQDELQAELVQLETAIEMGEAEVIAAEQEKGRYDEDIRLCRAEQENIMSRMDPGVKAMIELGRQMERGAQRRD